MLVNVSNHPSSGWGKDQKMAAAVYGTVQDVRFPNIPSDWDICQVEALAEQLVNQIVSMKPTAVLCQGEMTLTYQLVKRLTAVGICVISACSERIVQEEVLPDGTCRKMIEFHFAGFRKYESDNDYS